MSETMTSTGRYATPHGLKYMTQLCKHFGHKVPAEIDGDRGRVTFPMGVAHLEADADGLTARLNGATEDALEKMQGIIDSHLQRFAFREEFGGMDWSPVPAVR